MNDLGKKAGYLKGLMEGMDFSGDPSTGKLLGAMSDLLNEMSDRVLAMEDLLEDLNDYVESIDDDLAELEGERADDFPFSDEDEEDEYLHDLEEGEDQLHLLGGKAENETDTESLAGYICPECGKMFFISIRDPEGAIYRCPHCHERIHPEPLTPANAPIARPEN